MIAHSIYLLHTLTFYNFRKIDLDCFDSSSNQDEGTRTGCLSYLQQQKEEYKL